MPWNADSRDVSQIHLDLSCTLNDVTLFCLCSEMTLLSFPFYLSNGEREQDTADH